MRKVLYLTAGWILTLHTNINKQMTIHIQLINKLPLMAGLAILIRHSRTMRRAIQRARHRVRWFSFMMEHFAHRLPRTIARILHRSHPAPLVRKERIDMRSAPEPQEEKS